MARKLILFMHISLDGYATDLKGDLSWVPYDEELQAYAKEIVDNVGTPVYGRKTYELMESYWPNVLKDENASEYELNHAKWIEYVQKIVLSKTLKNPTWNNTLVISDHLVEEINELKQGEGKDLVIFGSPTASQTLLKCGLIDELLLTLCPVLLGKGISPFTQNSDKINLKLISSKTFKSGVLSLHYQVEK